MCPFRQYVLAKPDKHVMKNFLLAGYEFGYTFNGILYTGKSNHATRTTVWLVGQKLKALSKYLWNVGWDITADNYFTDFELAEELLKHWTAYVGTMRRNKRNILNESTVKKPEADVFLFGFDQYTTLVWYATKSNSGILLLLTMHYDNHVEKHSQIKYLFFFTIAPKEPLTE